MPIVKVPSRIEEYRARAASSDINEMTGRTGRADLTAFRAATIVSQLNISAGDVLVDIGCGDGSILRKAMITARDARLIGVLPTMNECDRLRAYLGDDRIAIKLGFAEALGLPGCMATHVVCNGVFLLLPDVLPAFREIARVTKPGATVFIGEVPTVNEMADGAYGDSIAAWLYFVLRKRGLGAAATALHRVARSALTAEPFIIVPKVHFYAEPDAFIATAMQCGLAEIKHFATPLIDTDGRAIASPTRVDYLFRRL